MSDKSTGFHGMVVPGTPRDSLFVLDGVLENPTTLEPVEVTSDFAGDSTIPSSCATIALPSSLRRKGNPKGI